MAPSVSPPVRMAHAMAYDADHGLVVLFGGYGATTLGDTWVWDGNNWAQKSPATSPPARWESSMAYDVARHQVVIYGGRNANLFGGLWTWDGNNWSEHVTAPMPPPRQGPVFVYDALHANAVLVSGAFRTHGSGMEAPGTKRFPPTRLHKDTIPAWHTTCYMTA
jgi:hypothetical protein